MTRFMTARRRQAEESVQVVRINIRERLDIDPVRTSELFSSFGEHGARGLIADTLADLEQTVERLRIEINHAQTEKASEIGVVAASMGFWSCARIAGDLRECARPGHTSHIPAIVERLTRTLTAAKAVDWRNPDQPG